MPRLRDEWVVTGIATVVVLVLLVLSRERSVEGEALWVTRVLFILLLFFENFALFDKEAISLHATRKNALIIFGFLVFGGATMTLSPPLFMDGFLLPCILSFIYLYYNILRNDRGVQLQGKDTGISIRTWMILFDCFNFLKIVTIFSLVVYHFLTSSTEKVGEIVTYSWAASAESLFPHHPNGNNQWILKILCSFALVLWRSNKPLYIPVCLSWLYLCLQQYYYFLNTAGSLLHTIVVPGAYPVVVFLMLNCLATFSTPNTQTSDVV